VSDRCNRPEYFTWRNMRQRCGNAKLPEFKDYGGRGISVCQRWMGSFDAFFADVGERPSDAHTLDRIDPDGNYEPGNVRWATRTEQQRNKRTTRLSDLSAVLIRFMAKRGSRTSDIAHAFGVSEMTVWSVRTGRKWKEVRL
jgi:hypothetical protein